MRLSCRFFFVVLVLLLCCFINISFADVHKDAADLKSFVDSGLEYIKKNGEAKAYKEFSNTNSKFRKGNLYLFVIAFNGKVLAHGGDPKFFIGKDLFNAKDKFGTPYFQLFVEAANKGGGVVSYYWPRPDTGALQYKASYIAPINDGAFIGAGVYKSLEVKQSQEVKIDELKKFVDSAAEYVRQKGAQEAYKEFNNPQGAFSKHWYVFVVNYKGKTLAHGGSPKERVGTNITDLKDEFGTSIFPMFIEAAKNGGGVVGYYWPDYTKNGVILFKTSYIRPLDDQTFIGAGFYEG
ncbi:MAG: cache domain-containing protein [bacterium]